MNDPVEGDQAIVQAARSALERSETAHRDAAAIPDAPAEWAADQAVLAAHAGQSERRLANFDPSRRMGASGSDALWQGEEALRREAASWRSLAARAPDPWKLQFAAAAAAADRAADDVRGLRDRLDHRDRAADLQELVQQQDLEAER